jgi:signal transduction histidine kinase
LRKFVFINGPDWHPYTQKRLKIWREILGEYGLECGDDRVSPPGPWNRNTGRNGVTHFLDEKGFIPGRDIDVMVCASDRIALGALEECRKRGIRVPGDLIITGYDNIQEAQGVRPSLTTVSQPFDIQTKVALDTLIAMIDGTELPGREEMKCNLVVGESCGCFIDRYSMFYYERGTELNPVEDDIFTQLTLLRSPLPKTEAVKIAGYFADFCSNGDEDIFFRKFVSCIEVHQFDYLDLLHWQDVITALRMHVAQNASIDLRTLVFRALHRLRVIVDEEFARTQMMNRIEELRRMSGLRKFSSNLTFCGDFASIWGNLTDVIAKTGIAGAWISLYVPDESYVKGGASEKSKLYYAYSENSCVSIPEEGIVFRSRDIVPHELWNNRERKTHVIHPLEYGGKSIGFAVFQMGPSDGTIYEAIAVSLSSALEGIDLNRELVSRNRIIENSIIELRKTQAKLVETEKIAALGELVAGVAHELNTPIGIGMTSATYILDISGKLERAISEKDIDGAKRILSKIREGSSLVFENMKRSTDLIDQFKQLSADEPLTSIMEFKCDIVFSQIRDTMKRRFEEKNVSVEIDCPENVKLYGHPVNFFNILKNLVLNSLMHGFEDRNGGHIRIRCFYEGDDVVVRYSDDGKGMSSDVLMRIFEPFFTTSRSKGGTGLGMHIVYNTLSKQFGGTIVSESSPNQGVVFTLRFPPIEI